MAWYEAHQTLAKHPKTLKLASLIKCERRYAVGLLHDLFSWGLDAAKKDGSLPGLSREEIAAALDLSGKKGLAVVDALIESGYLEAAENGAFRIHDWYDYAGKLMDKREADRRRKVKPVSDTDSDGNPSEFHATSDGIPIATVPNLTVPNRTNNISLIHSREEKLPSMVMMLKGYRERGWDTTNVYGIAESYGITREELDEAVRNDK